jgi:NAD(P)-dependent dehydrogenase (short-subunit alcohol dehydrogenase family)
MMTLRGQRVVVIGGSSGMGLAAARAAATEGARVVIAARDAERLARARAAIAGEVTSRQLDARDEAAVQRFFAEVGPFDHLVCTAHESSTGLGAMRAFPELDIAAARRFMDGKFWSQVNAARHALATLSAHGSIILFSGVASRKAMPRHTAIAAVNGAIEAFARALAHEIRPRRVNVVAPGLTQTPTYDAIPEADRAAFFAGRAAHLPVGRVGTPEDIAEAVLYLMRSGYSTGTVVDVDGGHLVE